MVSELGAEFERASGHTLDLNFATAGALKERVGGGDDQDEHSGADPGNPTERVERERRTAHTRQRLRASLHAVHSS